jgi:hypothetical protein
LTTVCVLGVIGAAASPPPSLPNTDETPEYAA